MYAVGRLGSYITRGFYTVSGPFHPFGGAVDIIVVEQTDGSFKSSPWYVRFGKFQGVLKAREKVVNVSVNGIDANFHMHLDRRGKAYFLREVEGDEGESVSSSSSNETDEQSQKSRRPMKSKSCDFDGNRTNSGGQIDGNNGKIVTRTNSSWSRIFGLVFGQMSMKEDGFRDGNKGDGAGIARISSLEQAEIAANLLDVKWSTNLATSKSRKDNASQFSTSDTSDGKGDRDRLINDGRSHVGSSLQVATETSVGHYMLAEETDSCNMQMGNNSHSGFENGEVSVEETSVEMSSLGATEQNVETFVLDESFLEEKLEEISGISRTNNEPGLQNADEDGNSEGVISKKSGFNRIQSFIYCKKSDNSLVGLDGSKEQSAETLYLTSGGPGDVNFCAETLHVTTELLREDTVTQQDEEIELETVCTEFCDNYPQLANPSPSPICGHDEVNLEVPLAEPNSYTQMVTVDPIIGLTEIESKSSSFTNSVCQFETGINVITGDKLQPSLESVGGSEQLNGDCDLANAVSVPVSESSEEELIFSDLDDFKRKETQGKLKFLDGVVEENNLSFCPQCTDEVNGPLSINDESFSSQDSFFQKNQLTDVETSVGNSKEASSPISIPNLHRTAGAEVGRLAESLPNMWTCSDDMGTEDLHHPLSRSLDSDSKPLQWKLHSKDESCCINSVRDKENQSSPEPSNKEDSHHPEIKNGAANPAVGDPSKAIVTTGGSWRLWPFTFRRSRSRRITQPTVTGRRSSDAENFSDSNIYMDDEKNVVKPKISKKMIRAIAPTSEELASLNLKEGSNTVTFTFSSAMLGRQKVDARIYLWKWNTRIVISDVDGTITKSDVLGQFMPLVGMDWSQTGVAPLFSAIKENGYQLLFLSARAISQAYHTRQFLVNLKQNGKALPDGPVVISPDGLFPSLFREVIRRAPHEFKIACLEDIKALFPLDCNPFYAGFGNRDTDEISYLKGEVAVNRRVDTKSYTTLHDLVQGMFPTMTSSEQV
ncbi:hypothetical protein GH714_013610 [Hevea brasiliensis]|uniref:LNS2/PITP domain-containing protein n=1 Tax=Hevea brasiliensis TaxID=3981 RepID=A0A6A6NGX5_HEVBR|nr:hypothetical protein GH714_013610 [Hevea brasiliensis]